MRKEFAQGVLKHYSSAPDQVFMTGDLGFMALEDVRERFGNRFINAGVAEQNMVSMAAALASEGMIPWVYSISPFVTHRPFEQIRNDVCLHDLPVKLVGNGGGYGYGIMGATHHNIEDIGAMRLLPNMKVIVPLLSTDVEEAIAFMLKDSHPNYLRLNLAASFEEKIAPFTTWRKIKTGTGAIIIGTGPVIANLKKLSPDAYDALEIWVISIFPFAEVPSELVDSISKVGKVATMEEHAGPGGLGEALAPLLIRAVSTSFEYINLFAKGYPSGRYGDQNWHLEENGLAGDGLANALESLLLK